MATHRNKPVATATAAAGSVYSDAGLLPTGSETYPVTLADDTVGVIINAGDKITGLKIYIANLVSNKILKVYAPTGGTINGGAANAALSTASGHGAVMICLSATDNTWAGI